MKQWFSRADLEAGKLPGLARSQQNLNAFIKRIIIATPELTRPKTGKGGGFEVHFSALPEAAQKELQQRENKRAITPVTPAAMMPALSVWTVAEASQSADDKERDQHAIAQQSAQFLTARQRNVMAAREMILLSLEAHSLATGLPREDAIMRLVRAAKDGTLEAAQARVVAVANDKSDGSLSLSRRTIYNWISAKKTVGRTGLAPDLNRAARANEAPEWFDRFLSFYRQPSKPSVETALRAFTDGKAIEGVTARAARYWIKRLPALERVKGREGKLALRARMAYTARDFADLLPTSVYSADGKTFDAEIAHPIHGHPFRPEITSIIDVATRRVVGWSAALDENTFAVVDALRQACSFGGIPAIFYTDNGRGYKNKAFDAPLTGFMARAGITSMRALPYNSQAKGVVERLNQVYTAAAKNLATYIGKDMDKEAKLAAFKITRRELAFTGTSRTLTPFADFMALIDATLMGYNDRPHTGLPQIYDTQLGRKRHQTPNELWAQKCQDFEPVMPDQAELDDMFRPWVIRKTRRSLVEFNGNTYHAIALEACHGDEVIVGYDFRDAERVWVRKIDLVDGVREPGRLIAIAINGGHKSRYVSVSAEQAAAEKRNKGRVKRLEDKIDVINQELRPAVLVDMTTRQPAQIMGTLAAPFHAPYSVQKSIHGNENGLMIGGQVNAEPVQPQPNVKPANIQILGRDGRPHFSDDVGFAHWIAANPTRALATDIELLREFLTTHSTIEMLRMSGVDLESLRTLVRSYQTTGAINKGLIA